jgi:hypothetical protein
LSEKTVRVACERRTKGDIIPLNTPPTTKKKKGTHTVLEFVLVYEARNVAAAARTNAALGRYQGWGLLHTRDLCPWVNEHYDEAKRLLAGFDVQLVRWSALSRDLDDDNDFAVRLGVRSI